MVRMMDSAQFKGHATYVDVYACSKVKGQAQRSCYVNVCACSNNILEIQQRLTIKDTMGSLCYVPITEVSSKQRSLIHHSTTLGHRKASLL